MEHQRRFTSPAQLPIEVRRENWGWFGIPWPSYICYDEDDRLIEAMHKPFPTGEHCMWCDELFDELAGDSGTATQALGFDGPPIIRHVHKECSLRQVIGSLAHIEGRCTCYGGNNKTPDMTLREEAVEIWRRLQAGELHE
jgi:hypothetical protein